MNIDVCDLCGAASLDVRPGIAEYPDGYRNVLRCADHESCRARCIEAGGEWPLVEAAA